MALYRANITFDHGGYRIRSGDLVDDTNFLYTMFPTRFTAITDPYAGNAVFDGQIVSTGLATANPGTAGYVWNNGGTLMVSAG